MWRDIKKTENIKNKSKKIIRASKTVYKSSKKKQFTVRKTKTMLGNNLKGRRKKVR